MIPVDKLESIVGNTQVRIDCKTIRILALVYGTLRLRIISVVEVDIGGYSPSYEATRKISTTNQSTW